MALRGKLTVFFSFSPATGDPSWSLHTLQICQPKTQIARPPHKPDSVSRLTSQKPTVAARVLVFGNQSPRTWFTDVSDGGLHILDVAPTRRLSRKVRSARIPSIERVAGKTIRGAVAALHSTPRVERQWRIPRANEGRRGGPSIRASALILPDQNDSGEAVEISATTAWTKFKYIQTCAKQDSRNAAAPRLFNGGWMPRLQGLQG